MNDHAAPRPARWTPPPIVAALATAGSCVAIGLVLDLLQVQSRAVTSGLLAVTLLSTIESAKWARARRARTNLDSTENTTE